MFRLLSFAKINLGLEITGKRPDGYHDLKTIFQTIDLHDAIRLEETNTGTITLSGDDPAIEWDHRNTISRAFAAIYKNFTIPPRRGFNVFVEKKIPGGSGLGGGSSNAAVILLFLNDYFNLRIPAQDLISLAVAIGADVPFFLTGGTVLAEGVGEKMLLLEDPPPMPVTVVIPPVNVSTRLIFSNFILTRDERKSKIESFMKSKKLGLLTNDLEKTAFELFPQVGALKNRMMTMAYQLVLMSGSGAAVFGVGQTNNPVGFPGSLEFHTRSISRFEYLKRTGASPSGKASVFGADTRRFESSRPSHFWK